MATTNLDRASGFLGGLLNTLTERGRILLGLSSPPLSKAELIALGEPLLSRLGEGPGFARARSRRAVFAAATGGDHPPGGHRGINSRSAAPPGIRRS